MSTPVGFHLSEFGTDLLLAVFKFLDHTSLAATCCTCHKLKDVAENPSLWRALACERWHDAHASAFSTIGASSTAAEGNRTAVGAASVLAPTAPGSGAGDAPTGAAIAALRPVHQLILSRAHSAGADAGVAWKSLFEEGNGWEPPRLRHTVLQPTGDFISAMQPLRQPGGVAGGRGGGDMLLALADSEDLQVWRVRTAAAASDAGGAAGGSSRAAGGEGASIGDDGGGAAGSSDRGSGSGSSAGAAGEEPPTPVHTARHPLARHALIYSLAWIAGSGYSRGGGGGGSSAGGPGESSTRPTAGARSGASGALDQGPAAPLPDIRLAVGTHQGTVEWYEYGGGSDGGCNGGRGGGLRLLHTTTCGSPHPLVDLHILPTSGGGIEGGGILAALQDASFALAGAARVRNAVQLYDTATQRHLAAVYDPFESHEFVCCCPAAGSGRSSGGGSSGASSVDPHVLLVGSVHGSFCAQCFQSGLPSLCQHKHRSATAALSTLDARCPRGGLTQRFGLNHRSLYPRLATARDYYVFTSHAGTALEVHDRRAMSSPLYTMARMPRQHPAAPAAEPRMPPPPPPAPTLRPYHAGEGAAGAAAGGGPVWDELADEQGGEEGEEREAAGSLGRGQVASEALPAEGWREGPAALPYEHQGLWLEASEDVLVGRSDNGTLWMWDLSTSLGWARGPERSGLWHWMYEHGPLLEDDSYTDFGHGNHHEGAGRSGVCPGGSNPGAAGSTEGTADLGAQGGDGRSAGRGGWLSPVLGNQAVCLGSVACSGTMPVCSLAAGDPTALFTLGMREDAREYIVESVVAPWS